MLVSGVQQTDSFPPPGDLPDPGIETNLIIIHIHFFRLLSIIGYYMILNIVPCAMQ